MSEKVKVTREIANAIEFGIKHHDKDDIVRAHTNVKNWRLVGEMKPLREMPLDRLIKALYIGYEVEPEYSKGDWILTKGGRIREIEEIETDAVFRLDNQRNTHIQNLERHATPSEIAEEKERRFWNKHGRELREVRNGDLLNNTESCQLFTINYLPLSYDEIEDLRIGKIKVVCFAENRLDVKTNE